MGMWMKTKEDSQGEEDGEMKKSRRDNQRLYQLQYMGVMAGVWSEVMECDFQLLHHHHHLRRHMHGPFHMRRGQTND
jgi:hypothetical protein